MSKIVKVILDGDEYQVEVEDGQTILDAAIDAGIDPPYACKAASCCTCRARVLSGEIKMDANDPLSEEEIEEGFVITCQSHPLTDDVVVTYDDEW